MPDCPCGTGKPYKKCCGRYISGGKIPESAVDLMRSRYTAYTGKDAVYLLRTWHPGTRPDSGSFHFPEDIFWTGLEIMATEAGGYGDEQGTVEFAARFIRRGKPGSMREESRFARLDGEWVYVDGDVKAGKAAVQVKIGRNDLCPCGSGRKYKKCCLGTGN